MKDNKKCKLRGWNNVHAVPISRGKFLLYMPDVIEGSINSYPITRQEAKRVLGMIIPKGCKYSKKQEKYHSGFGNLGHYGWEKEKKMTKKQRQFSGWD